MRVPEPKVIHDERDYGAYVDIFRDLLKANEELNIATTMKNIYGLLSFSRTIFSASAVANEFLYFCLHGAATAFVLQMELTIPEASVYRGLKKLRSLGLISPALKVRKHRNSKGGPRPDVWAIIGSRDEEIAAALRLHYGMLSPKYRIAREIAQTILEDYIFKRELTEISYKEIIIQVKKLRIPFNVPDIAQLAATYLHEKGIKVWR